jgi:hypothetical protein
MSDANGNGVGLPTPGEPWQLPLDALVYFEMLQRALIFTGATAKTLEGPDPEPAPDEPSIVEGQS